MRRETHASCAARGNTYLLNIARVCTRYFRLHGNISLATLTYCRRRREKRNFPAKLRNSSLPFTSPAAAFYINNVPQFPLVICRSISLGRRRKRRSRDSSATSTLERFRSRNFMPNPTPEFPGWTLAVSNRQFEPRPRKRQEYFSFLTI